MKNKLRNRCRILDLLLVVFLGSTISYAQTYDETEFEMPPIGKAVEFEIKGGELHLFSIELKANQTARVEIVQNGVDVALGGMNPQGKYFMLSQSPSGFFGEDLILLTTKEAGKYKVSVEALERGAKKGKYTILLKEIRETNSEDLTINKAFQNISRLAHEAQTLRFDGTVKGKRVALAKWVEIIENAKVKKDRVWEAQALLSRGQIFEALGEYQNALDTYLGALHIWRELKNRQYEATAINNLGAVYFAFGGYEKAVSQYTQALKIQREIGNRISEGVYLNNLGVVYRQLKEYEKAEEFLRKSLAIKREDETARGRRRVANTLNNLGTILVLQKRIQEGVDSHQQALDLSREIEFRSGMAASLLSLGTAQLNSGREDEGYKNVHESNVLARELGDRRREAESFYRLAVAEKEKGDRGKAIENISRGLKIIEQIRDEITSSEARYSYFSTVQNYYELYTNLLIGRYEETGKQEDVVLALEVSERSRSRSLVELLRQAKVDLRQDRGQESIEKLKDLQSELNEQYAKHQRLLSGKPTPKKITSSSNAINDLNAQILNFQSKIRVENPNYWSLTQGETSSASEIQSLLDNETVLVEYKLGEDRSFAWFVSNDQISVAILPPRKEIEAKARSFYEMVVANKSGDRANTIQASKDLGNILLKPFAAKLAGKRVAVVADGALQYTPFSALTIPNSNSKMLADENEIVVLPSASVLTQLRENSKISRAKSNRIAIFADPVFDSEDSRIRQKSAKRSRPKNERLEKVFRDFRFSEKLPRLLASRQEAKNIASFSSKINTTVKTDFQANLRNVEEADLSEYKILHFATHGLLNTKRPELSGLVFSLFDQEGNSQDGFLSLNDIYNLDLSSDMIVLSACQTALGKEVRGEGMIGVSRGFLYAGSNRIVASLWKVDDSATAEFMKLFYRNHLQKGMSASASLRQAKIDLKKIARFRSPFYWSAFVLLGDWK